MSQDKSLSASHHYEANEGTCSTRRDGKYSVTMTIGKYYVADSMLRKYMLRKYTLARAKHRSSPGPSHAYNRESSC